MYAVFHSARAFGSDRFSIETRISATETQSYDEALIFAEVIVSEHADNITANNIKAERSFLGLRYAATGNGRDKTGYMLRTSNGSDVFYTVKRLGE